MSLTKMFLLEKYSSGGRTMMMMVGSLLLQPPMRLVRHSIVVLSSSTVHSSTSPPPPFVRRHPISLSLLTSVSSLLLLPSSSISSIKRHHHNNHRHHQQQQQHFSSSSTATLIGGICCCRRQPTSSSPPQMGSITQLSSVVQQQKYCLHSDHMPPPAVAPAAPLTLEPLLGPDAGILVAHISVPSTRNAFSRALAQAFRDMVDQLRYGLETRALILTSAVPQAFCSGVDLKERRKMTSNEVFTFVDGLRRTITDLSELPFPTIACIDGCALGGGLELALACDIRIATPRSELGLPETRLAIIPGCGGTQRLPRVVGVAKAKELILTGRKIRGDEAAQIGLLNHLTDDPFAKALEIARDVLKTGPLANRVAKLAVEQGFDLELRSGLVVEQQCYAQLMPTKDRLEALDAFAQKRPPKFKGE